MLNLMKFLFISISVLSTFLVIVKAAKRNDDGGDLNVGNWELDNSSPPPAIITAEIGKTEANTSILRIWTRENRLDFDLTVIVNPFIDDEINCDTLKDLKNQDLRRHKNIYSVSKGEEDSELTPPPRVPITGCYYFIMKSKKEERYWQEGPLFFRTNVTFMDTKIQLLKDPLTIPADENNGLGIMTILKIPLRCMTVRAYLIFHPYNENGTEIEKRSNPVPEQECRITHKNIKLCAEPPSSTNITLMRNIIGNDSIDEWTADVRWRNLQSGGGIYVLRFMPNIHDCMVQQPNGYSLFNWIGFSRDIRFPIGPVSGNNSSDNNKLKKCYIFLWIGILSGLAVGLVIAIFTYWLSRYARLVMRRLRRARECLDEMEVTVSVQEENEANDILVIYKKEDEGPLMEQINRLKIYLEENLSDFDIHDVYDERNDWSRINELGALGWVEEMLKRGSKIVWVDTPEFRSHLKDKQKQYGQGDCRDDAMPYAVPVAKDSFQDFATQYRRHFVVRLKGFEVHDGDGDPLQTVTPYARYYIPEHLDLLCEGLYPDKRSKDGS